MLRRYFGISADDVNNNVPDWELAALISAWNRAQERNKQRG